MTPKFDKLAGIAEANSLADKIIEHESANAFLTIWDQPGRAPYPPQMEFWNSSKRIKAVSGANQCLRGFSDVLLEDGSTKEARYMEVGDRVWAFDFKTFRFVPANVIQVFVNEPCAMHRFSHADDYLECTRAHKVCVQYPSGFLKMIRVMRAVRERLPVVIYRKGVAVLSRLEHDFGILPEPTYDLTIDHPDHAFVCDGIVVSNSGKSLAAAVNVAWDATGIYPDFYTGPKTTRGADIWVLGDTTDNTRDAAQRKLFGPNIERPGWTDRPGDEAMINEKYVIGRPTRKSTGGAIDTIKVQHVPSQTVSTISFKTHSMEQQALASWSGQRAWIDEECPIDILDEIIARMSSTNGIIYCTYCPQHGRTPFVNFMETNAGQDVFLVKLTYDHVRHITEETKARNIRLWAHNPALLAARTRGEAVANTGLIFTFPTERILYDPRQIVISSRWPRLSGMDVGWVHPTAAAAIAIDPLSDVAYLYATYEQVEKPPAYHHAQLRQWGENMRFMIDLAAGQRGQKDGEKIIEEYWELAHGKAWEDIEEKDRKYVKASRAFQATMGAMWHRFDTQRLFINRNLRSLIQQYDSYIWDKDGEKPADETPARRYDIITSARYGIYGISEYATCLDDTPPWGRMEFEESTVIPPEWKMFKAGDERGIVDSFGRPY